VLQKSFVKGKLRERFISGTHEIFRTNPRLELFLVKSEKLLD
jgi:hypothetical protein